MKKLVLTQLLLAVAIVSLLGVSALGQVIHPTPYFTSFFDSASTYLGQPLVPGTIITAYDQSGVLCGMDTVLLAGHYGFMPVYGDDAGSADVDEGAEPGETIVFKINGRTATVEFGDPTFTDQTNKNVRLAATATIAMSAVSLPSSKLVTFNDTIQFEIGIRNDGDGLDFYGVTADNSNGDFTTLPQTASFYADPGEVITVYFEIASPMWTSDTTDNISFTVYSMNDPSVKIEGNVDLYLSITDVPDGPGSSLPNGFSLNQNFPNPFNPTTTIAFALPSGSQTNLEIIDILGRIVERRDLGYLNAGDHEIQYDASALSSGVYFYRVVTESGSLARKMVLLK